MTSLPQGFDIPHLIVVPPVYNAPAPSRLRARFCADCKAGQYAVRGQVLGETSHYCHGGGAPVLVHWPLN